MNGPKVAVCETTIESLFVIDSAFTTKYTYFQTALAEASDAFNSVIMGFGYTQKPEVSSLLSCSPPR